MWALVRDETIRWLQTADEQMKLLFRLQSNVAINQMSFEFTCD
jgi:hypothetical protein